MCARAHKHSAATFEEAGEPSDHDLVVVPALDQLLEHVLALLLPQRGEDVGDDVRVESLAVSLVQLLGEVVGRLLRAHVVDGTALGDIGSGESSDRDEKMKVEVAGRI